MTGKMKNDPLSVPCPSCNAPAGTKCTKLTPGPHKERKAASAGGGDRNPHPSRRGTTGKRGPR